jgi:hypothetical protein
MRKISVLVGGIMLIGALAASAAPGLKVTATITAPPGTENPLWSCVMWIEDGSNHFVSTFGRWGKRATFHAADLPIWNSVNGGDTAVDVDGITGATQTGTVTLAPTWTLISSTTRKAGGTTKVADGTYKFCIEVSPRYTSVCVKSLIQIGVSDAVKNGVDTNILSGSTYIQNVSGVYTAPSTAVVYENSVVRRNANPYSFTVPNGFSGRAVLRLVTPDGRQVWEQSYTTGSGTLNLSRSDIRPSGRYSGMGILEASFGGQKIAHQILMTE